METKLAKVSSLGVWAFIVVMWSPLNAGVFTWDGDTDNDIFNGNNWIGDVAPITTADSLIFPGGLGVGASTSPTVTGGTGTWFASVTFDVGAPSYTFTGPGVSFEFDAVTAPGQPAAIANNSTNNQVINNIGASTLISGIVTATSGDIVINTGIAVSSGSSNSSRTVQVEGSQNIYFNVDPSIHPAGNPSGGEWTGSVQSNMYNSARGRFTMDTFAGTAYLGDIGTAYQGAFLLTTTANGALRLTHNNSLGQSTTNIPGVQIWGGTTGNGTLELSNNISVSRAVFFLDGRSEAVADDPHILNVSGDNTLNVEIDWNTGLSSRYATGNTNPGNINFQSDSGTLTITGGFVYNTQPGAWTLAFRGAGNGDIQAQVTNYLDNPGFEVVKKGSGTWTLSNAANDYNGTTTIEEGTLSLGSTGALTNTPLITVKSGGTLDVSSQSALTLGSVVPQSLKGDGAVQGSVTILSGSSFAVDYAGSAIDSLAISGALDISAATIDFNDIGGALTGGPHVFATYGSLVGSMFANVIDLPLGFSIDYDYLGNQIALVSGHPGDFNGDGDVDGADFVVWQSNFPTASGASLGQGDADGDGDVDGADFVVWQTNFPFSPGPGASLVPEPTGIAILGAGVVALAFARQRRACRYSC